MFSTRFLQCIAVFQAISLLLVVAYVQEYPDGQEMFDYVTSDAFYEKVQGEDGSQRYNLKAEGKYSSDDWLTSWETCYHGTSMFSAMNITKNGFDLSKSRYGVHGVGIYCAKDLREAKLYSKAFYFQPHNAMSDEKILVYHKGPDFQKLVIKNDNIREIRRTPELCELPETTPAVDKAIEKTCKDLERLHMEEKVKEERKTKQFQMDMVTEVMTYFAKELIVGKDSRVFKKHELNPKDLKTGVPISIGFILECLIAGPEIPSPSPDEKGLVYYLDQDEFEDEVVEAYDESFRVNLKVRGKYSNDNWLFLWDVAYHGTSQINAISVAKNGDLSKTAQDLYGAGFYCTPDPKFASNFSRIFEYRSRKFRLVIQSFVDPKKKIVVNKEPKFWRLEEADSIRPRGVWVYPA